MSAEAEVSEGLAAPVDQNAQAAEDAKNLLAELEGNGTTNGASEPKSTDQPAEEKTNGSSEAKKEKDDANTTRDRSPGRGRGGRNDRGGKFNDRGGRGRGRGGRGGNFIHRDYRNNIKSDLTTQEESNDPVAIRKQVEFYFSDSNLPNDKFLLGKVGGSKNNPVELTALHSFKRMKHFQPFEAIVEAMRESTFLELCEDDTSVRRRDPLPTELDNGPDPNAIRIFEDRAMPRAVYAKGFGEETPGSQFDIEAFFAEYGSTNAVRLRRTDDKIFKGSVFVEFDTEETANKFLALDPKPEYKGKQLQIMSKKEYCDKKVEDIKVGKVRPNNSKQQRGKPHDRRGGGRDFKRKRDNEDDRDWRQRRDEDKKNGFREDKRKGRSDRDSRSNQNKSEGVERDERGVPLIKTNDNKDAATADALAKARAAVEADTANSKRAREDDDGDAERDVKKVDTKANSEVAA